jgi:16S rRNA (guanine527-N7)-methyltransferase
MPDHPAYGPQARLRRIAREMLNLELSPAQVDAFAIYSEELRRWNERVNLTAITDPEDIEIRHFVDSLTCLLAMRPLAPDVRVIDVGSGAGFPGLPIKIVCPRVRLTLVESTGKKVDFLAHIVEKLGLEGVTLANERAETLGQDPAHREQYDWVLARAVAGMRTLVEYLLPLAKVGGRCLPQKGESAPQETVEAQEAIRLLGGRVAQLTPIELPSVADTRYLVDIEKIATSPPQYPRRPGMPNKRPL